MVTVSSTIDGFACGGACKRAHALREPERRGGDDIHRRDGGQRGNGARRTRTVARGATLCARRDRASQQREAHHVSGDASPHPAGGLASGEEANPAGDLAQANETQSAADACFIAQTH